MNSGDIQHLYTEPLSIAKLLHENEPDNVMKFAIEKAKEYYNDNGVSPFIKSDKYDLYMLDYGWLVGRMADYYALSIADDSDEETIEFLKKCINDDFRIGCEYKNIRLLVDLFGFKEILYTGGNKKYAYNLCRYESKINGEEFYLSALVLDGKWIEKIPQYLKDILKNIGDRDKYVFKSFGRDSFNFRKFKNPNELPHQFV